MGNTECCKLQRADPAGGVYCNWSGQWVQQPTTLWLVWSDSTADYVVTILIREYLCCKVKLIEDGILHAVELEEMEGQGGALLSPDDVHSGMNAQVSYGAKHYMAVAEACGGV